MRCFSLFEIVSGQYKCSIITKVIPETSTLRYDHLDIIKIETDINEDDEIKQISLFVRKGDIVVLDGYMFVTSYQNKLRKLGVKIICIDDIHACHFTSDVVINHAPEIKPDSYSIEPYTELFLGLQYAILRKDFYSGSNQREINKFNAFLISMGGADIQNNSLRIVKQLLRAKPGAKVNIVIGPANQHIETLTSFIQKNNLINQVRLSSNLSAKEIVNQIQLADAMICPASTTLYEACAIGIPIISGKTADNQTDILTGFDNAITIKNIGNFNTISDQELYDVFSNMESMKQLFQQHYSNQKKLIDKRSPERILNVFKFVFEKHF